MTVNHDVVGSNPSIPVSTLLLRREFIIRKKVSIILLISKELAHKLNKEHGIPFGEDGISMTGKLNGRHKYYLCERPKNMAALEKATK